MLWVALTATPLPHRCEMAAAPGTTSPAAPHEGHHGHVPAPRPDCHCVGHACCSNPAAPTAVHSLPLGRTVQVSHEPEALEGRLAAPLSHVLPFSLAPPPLSLA